MKHPKWRTHQERETHAEQYKSWSVQTDRCLDRVRFNNFVRSLPKICVRANGILRFSEEPATARVFQLVGYRATLEAVHEEAAESPSRLVVIGRNEALKAAELERMFHEVLHQPGLEVGRHNSP